MKLRVPEGVEPRRVSVDAIEHWMIYREHPGVNAILHVHAWIEGTVATEINYPCGTVELAESVAELVRQAPDPTASHRRPTQPRPHHHRSQPRRDLCPDRRSHRPQGPHGLIHCRATAAFPNVERHMNHAGEGHLHPAHHPSRLARADVPGDDEHTPPRCDHLGQPFPVLPEREPRSVVLPAVALERELALRPGEVESIPTTGGRDPVLACRPRQPRARQQQPHLAVECRLQRTVVAAPRRGGTPGVRRRVGRNRGARRGAPRGVQGYPASDRRRSPSRRAGGRPPTGRRGR